MLEIGKQGKRKGRGTCRVKMRVCTVGWCSTHADLRSARNGTHRDIALDDISPFFAAVASASPELRR